MSARSARLLLLLVPLSLGMNGLRSDWALAAVSVALFAAWTACPPKAPPGGLWWACWLGWNLLSAAAGAEPLTALAAVSKASVGPALFIAASAVWRSPHRRLALWGLAAGAQLLGLAAALLSAPSYPMTGLLYPYYNYTAAVQCAAACACAAALLAGAVRNRKEKAALALCAAGSILWIVRAQSRGALAAFGVVLLLELLRSRRWRAASALVAAPLLAFLLLPAAFTAGRLKLDRAGSNERPAIWRSALEICGDHPLLGQGPGQFERGFLRHNFPAPEAVSPARYGMRTAHAHSELLQRAAETGWPGLLFWLLALGSALGTGAFAADADPTRSPARAAALAIFVQCLFDNLLFNSGVALVFYACLAIGAQRTSDTRADTTGLRPGRGGAAALGLAGLLLASWAWWPRWACDARRARATASAGTPAATEWARAALAVEPDNADLWEELAELELRATPPRPDRALAALSEAESRNPTNAAIPLLAGEILGAQGQWPTALPIVQRALELEPQSLRALLLRAEAKADLGRPDSARQDLAALDALRGPALEGPQLSDYARAVFHLDERRLAALRANLRSAK